MTQKQKLTFFREALLAAIPAGAVDELEPKKAARNAGEIAWAALKEFEKAAAGILNQAVY
jgi:hypothetical protein